VVIGTDEAGQFMRCLRCGDTMRFALPMPVSVWLAMSKAYCRLHVACQAAGEDGSQAILGQALVIITETADGRLSVQSVGSGPATSRIAEEMADHMLVLMRTVWESQAPPVRGELEEEGAE